MLAPVPHVLEERRQLAHALFQPATEVTFAHMVDCMACLCLLLRVKVGSATATGRTGRIRLMMIHAFYSPKR